MKLVTLLSGGLDSTVLLYKLVHDQHAVRALSVNYGQRHLRELGAAQLVAEAAHVDEWVLADLSAAASLFAGSSQTSPGVPVPEGHYTEASMKATVVPNRNMVMLSLAAAWAISVKAEAVCYAAHAGDHAIYPDCRPEFFNALDEAVRLADWWRVKLFAPFLLLTKAEIVALGEALRVPFGATWSCYKGGERHCGRCGTCVERREAFQLAMVKDPTDYEEVR